MLMVNLASVLLARAAQREHEFAVSRALGANELAVMRATLFEGGLLGLSAARGRAGRRLGDARAGRARAAGSAAPRGDRRRLADRRRVVGIGMVLGLLAAMVPATWAARASLSSLLASSAVRGGGGHGRMRRA